MSFTQLHKVQRPGTPVAAVVRPSSLAEALESLESLEPLESLAASEAPATPEALGAGERSSVRVLAGGTDLLLELNRQPATEAITLIDLTGIGGEFGSIRDLGDALAIGGGVRLAEICGSSLVGATALPLAQACIEIGSPQLRNRATLAGNLASASPANDSISALMALDAVVVCERVGSRREVPIGEFFDGFRSTVLAGDELITAIVVPKLGELERGLWFKLGLRNAQAISVLHGCVVVGFDRNERHRVSTARLSVGAMAPTVVLVEGFGQALIGGTLSHADKTAAIEAAVEATSPIDDVRASAGYRTQALRSTLDRALDAIVAEEQAQFWPVGAPQLGGASASREPVQGVITNETAVSITVNGELHTRSGAAESNLLDWLRETVGAEGRLTGTKEGCAEGECGACTVLVDGSAVMSCLVQTAQVDGGEVSTIEALEVNGELDPIQRAFVERFAVQCGFCIPGFVVGARALLDEVPNPTEDQIRHAFSGNLCRCTGYYSIIEAVQSAAGELQSEPGEPGGAGR